MKETIIAVIITAILGFGAGLHAHSIRDKAAERDELVEMMDSFNNSMKLFTIVNAETVSKQQELLEKQNATNKAIEGVKHAIKTKPVGGCSLTPNADSLRQQAYQTTAGSLSK